MAYSTFDHRPTVKFEIRKEDGEQKKLRSSLANFVLNRTVGYVGHGLQCKNALPPMCAKLCALINEQRDLNDISLFRNRTEQIHLSCRVTVDRYIIH